MKTTITDSCPPLATGAGQPPDTRPGRQRAPVHLPRPAPTPSISPEDSLPASEVDVRQTGRHRWPRSFWAVAFTVLGQMAIGAAIALGGDPIMGIGAAIAITICGLALISAEVVTNRAAGTDAAALANDVPAVAGGVGR